MTGTDQVPSGVLGRVQVLEAGHVAAHDDEVHALGVLDVEVAHGLAAAVDDPEGELERLALRGGAAGELERQALLADGQAAHRLRAPSSRRRRRHRAHAGASRPPACPGGRRCGCRRTRRRRRRAPAATAKPASLAGDVHAVTCAAWPWCVGVLGGAQQHHAGHAQQHHDVLDDHQHAGSVTMPDDSTRSRRTSGTYIDADISALARVPWPR